MLTFEAYVANAEKAYNLQRRNGIRRGQAFFNTLVDCRPDISESVRAKFLDPFYDDKKIPDFLDFVMNSWKLSNVLVDGSFQLSWTKRHADAGMVEVSPHEIVHLKLKNYFPDATFECPDKETIEIKSQYRTMIIVGNKASIRYLCYAIPKLFTS